MPTARRTAFRRPTRPPRPSDRPRPTRPRRRPRRPRRLPRSTASPPWRRYRCPRDSAFAPALGWAEAQHSQQRARDTGRSTDRRVDHSPLARASGPLGEDRAGEGPDQCGCGRFQDVAASADQPGTPRPTRLRGGQVQAGRDGHRPRGQRAHAHASPASLVRSPAAAAARIADLREYDRGVAFAYARALPARASWRSNAARRSSHCPPTSAIHAIASDIGAGVGR